MAMLLLSRGRRDWKDRGTSTSHPILRVLDTRIIISTYQDADNTVIKVTITASAKDTTEVKKTILRHLEIPFSRGHLRNFLHSSTIPPAACEPRTSLPLPARQWRLAANSTARDWAARFQARVQQIALQAMAQLPPSARCLIEFEGTSQIKATQTR